MNDDFGIDIIKKYVGRENFIKGKSYFPFYVRYVGDSRAKEEVLHFFRVNSEREPINYLVKITIRDKEIVESTCTCPQFGIEGCCKHIAASLYNYREELFPVSNEEKMLMLSKSLLEEIYTNRKVRKAGLRKQAHIEVAVEFVYRGSYMHVYLKIGENRMYSINAKISTFLNAYKDGRSCQFGKDFTYSPELYYLSNEDKKIIEFLLEYDKRTYYSIRDLKLTDEDIKTFLKLCEGKAVKMERYMDGSKYSINRSDTVKGLITSFEEGNPFKMNLRKDEGFYYLQPDNDNQLLTKLTEDSKYAFVGEIGRAHV